MKTILLEISAIIKFLHYRNSEYNVFRVIFVFSYPIKSNPFDTNFSLQTFQNECQRLAGKDMKYNYLVYKI